MKFAVETWSPDYGSPMDVEGQEPSDAQIDTSIEVPANLWKPRRPPTETRPPRSVLFVDGVRRLDAVVWILSEEARARVGLCASYGAGAVLCDGRARLVQSAVQRGLFTTAPGAEAIVTQQASFPVRATVGASVEELGTGVEQRMSELEVEIARQSGEADLLVLDGPLRGRQHIRGAVGYIKTHRVQYLAAAQEETISRLAPGERTPFFLITTSWTRYSWYLRLPGFGRHPWGGVVRCEVGADRDAGDVTRTADLVTAALPAFASAPHKEPRAPQNLYPVGGLERELRRRMGDPSLIYRSLRAASAAAS